MISTIKEKYREPSEHRMSWINVWVQMCTHVTNLVAEAGEGFSEKMALAEK